MELDYANFPSYITQNNSHACAFKLIRYNFCSLYHALTLEELAKRVRPKQTKQTKDPRLQKSETSSNQKVQVQTYDLYYCKVFLFFSKMFILISLCGHINIILRIKVFAVI